MTIIGRRILIFMFCLNFRISTGLDDDFKSCGQSLYETNLTSLIARGDPLKPGTWPWMAAFYHDFQYICGGSIVSEKIIVTAAHCIQDKGEDQPRRAEHSNFVVGKHNLNSNSETNHINVGVLQFIVHPSWKPSRKLYDADIALAVLKEPIVFRKNIRPICLPGFSDNHKDIVSQSGVLAGWGFNEQHKLTTNDPRIIEIPIIDDDECVEIEPNYETVMSNRGFCTAGNLGKGPCKGDSGSGLAIKQKDSWKLRGIVSVTIGGSCDGLSSVVFTDVAQFSNWIYSQMENFQSSQSSTNFGPEQRTGKSVRFYNGQKYLCSSEDGFDIGARPASSDFSSILSFLQPFIKATAERRDVDYCDQPNERTKWILELGNNGYYIKNEKFQEYLYNSNLKDDWGFLYTWTKKEETAGPWNFWKFIKSDYDGWYYISSIRSGSRRYIGGNNNPRMGETAYLSWQIIDVHSGDSNLKCTHDYSEAQVTCKPNNL